MFLLGRLFGDVIPGKSSSSRCEKARDREAGGVQSSVVCTPLLYVKISFTGEGEHSKTVRTGIVPSSRGLEVVDVTAWPSAWPVAWEATSEFSALSSPALRMLAGRLPLRGDAIPVDTETGLLSPTRLLIRDSISFRLSARLGEGAMSCDQTNDQSVNQSINEHDVAGGKGASMHTSLGLPTLGLPALA